MRSPNSDCHGDRHAAAQVACVGGTPLDLVHISPVYASRICQR
jgi:hypothetical protein